MQTTIRVIALTTTLLATPSFAADPASCAAVRMADLGWTDIVLTNTTAELILTALGYQPSQTLLGLDVSFVSMRSGELPRENGSGFVGFGARSAVRA